MSTLLIPSTATNWINGSEAVSVDDATFDNLSPATGQRLCRATRSKAADIDVAVTSALRALPPGLQ